ncbi:glycerophosphodiester phosphodiesterase [Ectobacillus sp. sgz5001026]|uniref:glycerophosphodiester phosphodiesterase n=1 Tax=Ectobacillus sp. sgz5001026 TaxID=3242473 RepID=UPI0036D3DFF2
MKNQSLIFGHRGARGTHPENTMISFQEAARTGAHGIEFDVHLSKDGEVVIIHDETLNRTTNGSGLVCEHTLEELQKLDAGSHFNSAFQGARIPTLREVLAWLRGNKLLINIELKNDRIHYVALEQKVVALVREFGLEKRVIFSSFNHRSVAVLADLAPDIERAILYHFPLQDAVGEARLHHATGLHPNFQLLTKEFVDEAKSQGFKLRPYTINEEEDIKRMISFGVDVIITDWPSKALSLLHK